MPRYIRMLSWLVPTGAAVAIALSLPVPSSPPPKIDHTDSAMVDVGRRVYREACAACHGANLEGQPRWRDKLPGGRLPAPPHDVSGHTWHHPDPVLFTITKKGPAAYPEGYLTDMPAFADRLTDEEIAAVIAFIKSTWPEDILRRQLQTTARSSK